MKDEPSRKMIDAGIMALFKWQWQKDPYPENCVIDVYLSMLKAQTRNANHTKKGKRK